MPADRLLVTLLRALQSHSTQQDTPRLLATASSLLTTLSNPKNLTLLTAQLLSAPAVWAQGSPLRTCLRFIGAFQSAALSILHHEEELVEDPGKPTPPLGQPLIGGNLSRHNWVSAVISAADDRSPICRHALIFAGLLLGFEGQGRNGLSSHSRRIISRALIKVINATLEGVRLGGEEEGARAVVLALTYCFDTLDETDRAEIDYDRLLPALVGSAFFSKDGFRSGYFFATVDADVVQAGENIFTWSVRALSPNFDWVLFSLTFRQSHSPSFLEMLDVASQPLIATMGPLSKVMGHTVEHLTDPFLIQTLLDDLVEFSNAILAQWRQTKLSEVDVHEEPRYLDEMAMSQTIPVLWRLLRAALFAVSIVLNSVIGRILGDRSLAVDTVAPMLATQILYVLRHLYFISARLGPETLSQYTFVYLTAIDILSAFPSAADTFIRDICPSSLGQVPLHPLDRVLDLFFLNTAECFTITLPAQTNETVLIAATIPYLIAGGDNNLIDIFEAAHSVTLAVFSSPQNANLAGSHIHLYVDALFKVFPQNLSSRQFRLAFKTLVRITAPPSPLSSTHSELPEILLELVYHRILQPPSDRRPAPYAAPLMTDSTVNSTMDSASSLGSQPSEDIPSALILTLIDSLPYIPLHILEEWLRRTAALIPGLKSLEGKKICMQRFWEVLSDGEMDVERSQACVAWWTTNGGRAMVTDEFHPDPFKTDDKMFVMSGALNNGKL